MSGNVHSFTLLQPTIAPGTICLLPLEFQRVISEDNGTVIAGSEENDLSLPGSQWSPVDGLAASPARTFKRDTEDVHWFLPGFAGVMAPLPQRALNYVLHAMSSTFSSSPENLSSTGQPAMQPSGAHSGWPPRGEHEGSACVR
jgi:hypothetical protein